jgi:hypothetical protein
MFKTASDNEQERAGRIPLHELAAAAPPEVQTINDKINNLKRVISSLELRMAEAKAAARHDERRKLVAEKTKAANELARLKLYRNRKYPIDPKRVQKIVFLQNFYDEAHRVLPQSVLRPIKAVADERVKIMQKENN